MEQSTSQAPAIEHEAVRAPHVEQLTKLPSELLYHIFRLAASTDYKTAHSCAFVSKAICEWTRADRWKTIVITNFRQLEALCDVLYAASSKATRLDDLATSKSVLNLNGSPSAPLVLPSEAPFTSFPSIQPGSFVENLFVETQKEYSSKSFAARPSSPGTSLQRSQQIEAEAAEQFRQTVNEDLRWQHRELQDCGMHSTFLRYFPNVNYLALGGLELGLLGRSVHRVSPKKFLFTHDSRMSSFVHHGMLITDHSHWRRCELVRPTDIPNTHDPCPYWIPCLAGIRRRLTSMHVIGIDLLAERSGVPIPFAALEPLRSGSTARHSMLINLVYRVDPSKRRVPLKKVQGSTGTSVDVAHAECSFRDPGDIENLIEDQEGWQSGWQPQAQTKDAYASFAHPADNPYGAISRSFVYEASQGLTSLRYDTRKFSLRPCEITASRLKDFFREIVAAPDKDPTPSLAPSFSHSGPRHAAPLRGSGNFVAPNQGNGTVDTASREQKLLDLCGSKQFKKLQICWDPRPTSPDVASNHVAKQSASDRGKAQKDDGSSWPMERQDIWTNTSSHNNEARAPPPHQADRKAQSRPGRTATALSESPARAAKDPLSDWKVKPQDRTSDSKSFRADLVDAFRTTLGWTAHDQALLSSSLPALHYSEDDIFPDDISKTRYQKFLTELVERSLTHHPGLDEKGERVKPDSMPPVCEVKLELRPPAEILKLGEHYVPYTKAERVEWFLANLDTDEA